MRNNPTLVQIPPPIATVTSDAAAIYNPPSDGFPFLVAVFSPDGAIQALSAFPSRGGAEGFLRAIVQEGAPEYGMA